MKQFLASCLSLGLVLGLTVTGATTAEAQQRRSDQGEARKEMRAGNILRARDIEARILPRMRGAEYLGFDYDSTAMAYRFKFIRDGRVIFIDVDARTGQVMRMSR